MTAHVKTKMQTPKIASNWMGGKCYPVWFPYPSGAACHDNCKGKSMTTDERISLDGRPPVFLSGPLLRAS